MHRLCVLLVLVVALLGFAGGATAQTARAGDASAAGASSASSDRVVAGKVELVEGDVRVYDGAQKQRTVGKGDAVYQGDSIVTGKDGELHVDMADGGFIAVRPNTKMRVDEFRAEGDAGDKGFFSLLQGSFRSITGWIGKYNPRAYRVRTPTATIGIRGTDHEPMVIPPGSDEGEPGTYDKVNAGGSYIQTPQGKVDVPVGRAAFSPHAPKPGQARPRLLADVPRFFRATRNEHLLEHRHEMVQQRVQHLREDRRQRLMEERRQRVAERQARRQETRRERLTGGNRERLQSGREARPDLRRGERSGAEQGRQGVRRQLLEERTNHRVTEGEGREHVQREGRWRHHTP